MTLFGAAMPDGAPLALILASAMLHATLHALLKQADDKGLTRMLWGLTYQTFLIPALFFVPLPQGQIWLVLIATAIVQYLYQLASLEAYRHGDLTQIYPLMRGMGPGLTALGAALWFRESLSITEIIGLCVLTLGILLLVLEKPLLPQATSRRGYLLAALAGCTIALYTLLDAYGVRHTPNPLTYIFWFFMLNSMLLVFVRPVDNLRRLRAASRRDLWLGVAGGVLAVAGYALALLAQRIGKTADIAATRETSIVFAVLIGFFILGERVRAQRWLAALMIAGGVVFMHLR